MVVWQSEWLYEELCIRQGLDDGDPLGYEVCLEFEKPFLFQALPLHRESSIARALTLIQVRNNIAQEVTQRVERLKAVARYRSPTDTSPVAESTSPSEGDVLSNAPTGATAARMPNVIGEDIFDLFRVLLR